MAENLPLVSACIVSYRCFQRCRDTVQSLLSHTKGCRLQLYIVDNCSGDGSFERLRELFPTVQVLQSGENLGYGGGNNLVLPLLQSEFHAVVNPDIELRDDLLTSLALYLREHPEVGTVTPRILNPDGTEQPLPKRDPFLLGLVGRRLFGRLLKKYTDRYTMADREFNGPTDIEFATGCFFMMRTGLFKELGGFDQQSFFMHFEDADISRRARQKLRLQYLPGFSAVHLWERDSAKHASSFMVMVKSMFRYFGKWGWKLT